MFDITSDGVWSSYTLHYRDKMSFHRWQYPKSLSLWGHFLVPMRKTADFFKCENSETH